MLGKAVLGEQKCFKHSDIQADEPDWHRLLIAGSLESAYWLLRGAHSILRKET